MNATVKTNAINNTNAAAVSAAFSEKIAAARSGKMTNILKAAQDGRVELINAGRIGLNEKIFANGHKGRSLIKSSKWVSDARMSELVGAPTEFVTAGEQFSGQVFVQRGSAAAKDGAYIAINGAVGAVHLSPSLVKEIIAKFAPGKAVTKASLVQALKSANGWRLFSVKEHRFVAVFDTAGVKKTLTETEYLEELGLGQASAIVLPTHEEVVLAQLVNKDQQFGQVVLSVTVGNESKQFVLDKSKSNSSTISFAGKASTNAQRIAEKAGIELAQFKELCEFLGVKAPKNNAMNAQILREPTLTMRHIFVATEGRTYYAEITNLQLLLAVAIASAGSTNIATVLSAVADNPGVRYAVELKGVNEEGLKALMNVDQEFFPAEELQNRSPNMNEKLAQIGAVSAGTRNSFAACYYADGKVLSAFDALKSIARFKLNRQSGYELGKRRVAFITGLYVKDQATGELVAHPAVTAADKVKELSAFGAKYEAKIISAYEEMIKAINGSPVAKMLVTGAGHASSKFVLDFGVVRITSESAMIKSVVSPLGERFDELCKDLDVEFILPTPKAGAFGIGHLLMAENGTEMSQSEYMAKVYSDQNFRNQVNEMIAANVQHISTPEGEVMEVITTEETIIGKNFYNLEGFYLTKKGQAAFQSTFKNVPMTKEEKISSMFDDVMLDETDDPLGIIELEEENDPVSDDVDEGVSDLDKSIIKWALKGLYDSENVAPIARVFALMKAGYIARRKKVSSMNIQALQSLQQFAGKETTQKFIDHCVEQTRDVASAMSADVCDISLTSDEIKVMLMDKHIGLFRFIKKGMGPIAAKSFEEFENDGGMTAFTTFIEEYLHGARDENGETIEGAWPGVHNIKYGVHFVQEGAGKSFEYVIPKEMMYINEEVVSNAGEVFAPDGMRALHSVAMMYTFAADTKKSAEERKAAFKNAHMTWANYMLNMSKAMFGKGTFEVQLPNSANLVAVPNLYSDKVLTNAESVRGHRFLGMIKYPTVLENSVRFFKRGHSSIKLDESLFEGMSKEAAIELSNFIGSRVVEVPALSHLNNQDDFDGDRVSIFTTPFSKEEKEGLVYGAEKLASEYSVISRAIKMAGEMDALSGIGSLNEGTVKEISDKEWADAAVAFARSKSDTGVFTNGLISVTHALLTVSNIPQTSVYEPEMAKARANVFGTKAAALTIQEVNFLSAMLGEGLQKGAIAAMKDDSSVSDIAVVLNRVDGRASAHQFNEPQAVENLIDGMAFNTLKAQMPEGYTKALLVRSFLAVMARVYTTMKVRPTMVGKINGSEWDKEQEKFVALTPSIQDVAFKNEKEAGKPVHMYNSVRLAQGSYYKNTITKVFNASDFEQNVGEYFQQFVPAAAVVLGGKSLSEITGNVKTLKAANVVGGKINKAMNIMGMVEMAKEGFAAKTAEARKAWLAKQGAAKVQTVPAEAQIKSLDDFSNS